MTDAPQRRGRRRRDQPHRRGRRAARLFGAGMLAAVLLMAAGLFVAVRGFRADNGASGAVRGYFTALARGKAATALAYGTVPPGPHTLLLPAVLRRQLQIAPLRKFTITGARQHGPTAHVDVRYVLAFAGSPQQVTSTVTVSHLSGHWRLTTVAVSTDLRLDTAAQRIVGLRTPAGAGTPLVFPGALPLTFDTPYLAPDPRADHVELGGPSATDVLVDVSPEGRAAAVAAVTRGLAACLRGTGGSTCPQPSQRYVPDSLRGTLTPGTPALAVTVGNYAAGVLQVSGTVTVNGTYQQLTFANRAVTGRGKVQLPVTALAYAVPPVRVVWGTS